MISPGPDSRIHSSGLCLSSHAELRSLDVEKEKPPRRSSDLHPGSCGTVFPCGCPLSEKVNSLDMSGTSLILIQGMSKHIKRRSLIFRHPFRPAEIEPEAS